MSGDRLNKVPQLICCVRRSTINALQFQSPRVWSIIPLGLGIAALSVGVFVATLNGLSGRKSNGSSADLKISSALPRPPLARLNIIEPIAPTVAVEVNAARPDFEGVIEAAKGFALPVSNLASAQGRSAEECLAQAVYYESAGQPLDGQRAVAQVVLNRMRHPAYPKSVCGVVYQGSERRTGCQFTFTCDGSLARKPSRSGWDLADRVARQALSGTVQSAVGTATNYHADFVVPYWASSLQKLVTIGNHIFYRYPGFWGSRRAFNGVYAGEPQSLPIPSLPIVSPQLAELTAESSGNPLGRLNLAFEPRTKLVADGGSIAIVPANAGLRADDTRGKLLADEAKLTTPDGILK